MMKIIRLPNAVVGIGLGVKTLSLWVVVSLTCYHNLLLIWQLSSQQRRLHLPGGCFNSYLLQQAWVLILSRAAGIQFIRF